MSDLIHKEDAVYAVINAEPFLTICGGEWDGEVLQRASDVTKAIMSVPSADRPTGEWNRLSYDTFHCNLCGHTFIVMQGDDAMNYCPNCGAIMNGGEEE